PSAAFEDVEQMALAAWINKYRPDLKDNYQENGGYYVEILDEGCADSLPVAGKSSWVWFDFTGRDLQGNVCVSRDDAVAQQQGSYTNYTHYVPYYRFCGEETSSMLEGSYLAISNELKIGDKTYTARYGTKMRLYLPSSVVASGTGMSGDGGYEGQFSLDGNKPMIVEMTLYGHTTNPVAYEGNHVDSFADINGGICTEHRKESDDDTATSSRRRFTRTDTDDEEEEIDTRPLEFYDGRWHQPVDTLAQLYVKYAYSPATDTFDFNAIGADTLMYPNQNTYNRGKIYGTKSMAAIDREINDALIERFGNGIGHDEVLTTDSVTSVSKANIWYITRLLDGYVVDTNIDEVKRIVYNEVSSEGSALQFKNGDSEENDLILAWLYSIPTMRLGQWASILTVSTYAYGIAGKTGATNSTTTSSSSYDWLNYYNYMNYMNSYYGYSYGGIYNNGYYGYNPYYYGYGYPYYGTTDDEETTTVVSTLTEVLPYSPMLFQIYIEPAE
ncbi:MAG: hypothetical protein K2J31_07720, partial [Alistipes sp.]|nr:hypothetical protein [Alistipes sp.]